MNENSNLRAGRIIVSALLASELTSKELKSIADEFIDDGKLPKRVGRLLRNVLDEGGASGPTPSLLPTDELQLTGDPLIDEAIQIIKRKRLSKVRIVSAIAAVNPAAKRHFMDRLDMPVEVILREFSSHEPREKVFEFLEALDGRSKRDDDYLKGIMRGKRNP